MLLRSILALALLTPTLAHAQARLFTEADRSALTARQAELLSHTEALAPATEVWVAEVNLAALSASWVTFDLAADRSVTLQHTRTERPATGQTLFFQGADAAGTHAVVVEREGQLTGSVRLRGQLYSIRPLTGGLHAIVQVDENRFIDHPDDWDAALGEAAERFDGFTERDGGGDHPTLERGAVIQRVLVPYTAVAASQVGDIIGLVQLAVAETNQSYADSDINVRLELAHTYETPQNGSSNFSTTLNRMANPNDGFHDEISGLRAQYGADMVGMIVGSNSFLCGQAYRILADTADEALQVTSQSCATGYYSFGHEFGHLQGARHNTEIDGSSFPFPYGHGKCYSPGGWRTVMSYGCPGFTSRVPRWSNPDVDYFGEPLGDTALRDNARVLDETASMIAAFYADPVAATVTGTITSGSPVPSGGGTVTFDLTFSNSSSASFSGEYWVDVFFPNGAIVGRSPIERSTIGLDPGQSATLSFSGTVPARAPGGTYTLRAYIGTSYPDDVADSDDFAFSKVGSRIATSEPFDMDIRRVTPDRVTPDAASRQTNTATGMLEAYPNPFGLETTLRYQITEPGTVELTVYDVLGRSVATLAEGAHEAGVHETVFAAGSLPSGVYVWRLTSGMSVETGRLLLAR